MPEKESACAQGTCLDLDCGFDCGFGLGSGSGSAEGPLCLGVL